MAARVWSKPKATREDVNNFYKSLYKVKTEEIVKIFEEGSSTSRYEPVLWEVTGAEVMECQDSGHPIISGWEGHCVVYKMKTEAGKEHTEVQTLKVDGGRIKAAMYPSFIGDDGEVVPAKFSHDLIEWAKAADVSQPQITMEGFSKARFVGLKVLAPTYFGVTEEGEEFIIIESSSRRAYDEKKRKEYEKAQAQGSGTDGSGFDFDI